MGVATQWSPNTIASHTSGERVGSATSSVITSATDTRTAPPRAFRGRIHARGRTHAAYHGSSTGETSSEMRLAQPMAPTTTTGSSRSGSRARWRSRTTMTHTNTSGKATRTTSEATS
jgi:hypothetical protein